MTNVAVLTKGIEAKGSQHSLAVARGCVDQGTQERIDFRAMILLSFKPIGPTQAIILGQLKLPE